MSLDAISRVTEAEESTLAQLAEAKAEAKRLVAEAEHAGVNHIAQARTDAEAEVQTLLAAAQARADDHSKQVLEQSGRECDALRAEAGTRLSAATDLIVQHVRAGGGKL